MKIITLAAAVACLLFPLSAQSQTPKTKTQLQSEVTGDLPNNNIGAITPAILRSLLSDTINSVSTLKDQNTFTAKQTFSPTSGPSVVFSGNATPSVQFSPSTGSTKIGSIFQTGDTVVLSDSGVANRVSVDLATGDVSLLTGGIAVGIGGTTASLSPPGLTPTAFTGTGVNPAISFINSTNPGVNGNSFYLHWYMYNSAGDLKRAASIGPGLSSVTAGSENGSIDFAFRVGGALRSVAAAGLGGTTAGFIPDAVGPWSLGQAGQGWTTIRLENSYSSAVAASVQYRDISQALPAGLFRTLTTGGFYRIQRNTAVAGDFSTTVDDLTISDTGGTTVRTLITPPDVSGSVTLGRFSSGFPWAIIRPDAGATGFEFRDNAGNARVRLNTSTGAATLAVDAAIPAGGTAGLGLKFSTTTNFGIFFGSGAPTLSAAQGSVYFRSDGSSTSTRMYVNTDGSMTWAGATTAF